MAELFHRLKLPTVLGELLAGMISWGEVGLIVAGVGVASDMLTSNVYSTIVIMITVSTIITTLWLKSSYKKEAVKQS